MGIVLCDPTRDRSCYGAMGDSWRRSITFFYIVFFITAIVGATFVTFLYTYILSLIACGRFVLTCSHPCNTYVFNAVFIIGNVFIFSIVVYISPIVTVIVIISVLFSVFQRRGWKWWIWNHTSSFFVITAILYLVNPDRVIFIRAILRCILLCSPIHGLSGGSDVL